jgi:hypothetical protein
MITCGIPLTQESRITRPPAYLCSVQFVNNLYAYCGEVATLKLEGYCTYWTITVYYSTCQFICVASVLVYTLYFTDICILGSTTRLWLNTKIPDMCHDTVHSVTLNVAYVVSVMHGVSTCASLFLNLYMISCRWHQHCSHVGGERTLLNHLEWQLNRRQ